MQCFSGLHNVSTWPVHHWLTRIQSKNAAITPSEVEEIVMEDTHPVLGCAVGPALMLLVEDPFILKGH